MMTIMRAALVAFVACIGVAQAQSPTAPDMIEDFDGWLSSHIEVACRSLQLFLSEPGEPKPPGRPEPPVRWAATPSPEICADAYNKALANLPQARRDRMYRRGYEQGIEACLRTAEMPLRADRCINFGHQAARRTYLRDYVLNTLTTEACPLLRMTVNPPLPSGYCIAFDMPPGDDNRWKLFLSNLSQMQLGRSDVAQHCRSRKEQDPSDPEIGALAAVLENDKTQAAALSRLAKAEFKCKTQTDPGGEQRGLCRRDFMRHGFSAADSPRPVSTFTSKLGIAIEIEASASGELQDACLYVESLQRSENAVSSER